MALAKAHADAGLGREHIRPFVDANCSKGRRGFGTRATKKNLAQKKPSWENTLTNAIMGGAKETFVLLVIDLEHTGHGSYSSDILQIGAVGALFTMLAEAPANVISSYDGQVLFDFNMDIRTDQLLNKNLDVVFHRNFPRQKIRDASPFLEVMSAFRSEVLTLKSGLPPNTKLLIAAHNGYVSDFSVLHCQFQRHGQSFADFLISMDVEGFVDTLVIARELNLPTKLSDLYKRLTGIELSNAHDAGADADAA